MADPLSIKGIHHIELYVGNALQAAYYYWKAYGFDQIAYLGPETGHKERASYALRQGDVRLVFSAPMNHENSMNVFHILHGDSVKDVCFEVEDVDALFDEVVKRGAAPLAAPADVADANGTVRRASIRTYGDTIHSIVSKNDYDGPFLPGFEARERKGKGTGLLTVDHVVGNVENRQMDHWAEFYIQTFGFHQLMSFDDKDISTEHSALRSKVVANPNRVVKMPINEPAKGLRKSQIQEYIDFHVTAGVQHIAVLTGDIISTITDLRENGVEFLDVPSTYYETVWDRVGDIKEDRMKIEELKILIDRDENGYLLQLFTKPVEDRPTLFLEFIQRRGCQSFGKGNFKALFEAIEREQERRGNL